jgi:predicted RNase H-like HicB family nuclease
MARTYTVVLEREEDGGYSVFVPALTGCYTQGATVEQALERSGEVIALFLESLGARGLPIPEDTPDVSVSTREAGEVHVYRVPVREHAVA